MAGIIAKFKELKVAVNSIKSGAAAFFKGVARTTNGANRLIDFSDNKADAALNTGEYMVFNGTSSRIASIESISGIKTFAIWLNHDTATESVIDFDGGATTIGVAAGVVVVKGITSPSTYVNNVETTTVTAGSWQLVVVSSDTAWTGSAIIIGLESGNYGAFSASMIRLFTERFTLEDATELYENPERVKPLRIELVKLALLFTGMAGGTSAYISNGLPYNRTGRAQNLTRSIGAPQPAPQTAILNQQDRLSFDSNSYVEVTSADELNFSGSDAYSVAARFYIATTAGNQGVIAKGNINSAWSLTIQAGVLTFRGASAAELTYSLTENLIYTVVAVATGTAAKLFVNGVQQDSGVIAASASTADAVQIGGYNSTNQLSGLVYWAAVYSAELTVLEAGDLHSGLLPNSVNGQNLNGLWINDGVSTWQDRTGNGNTGTVTGTTASLKDVRAFKNKSAFGLPFDSDKKHALLLRGSGHALVADSAAIDASTAITLECWVKLQSIGSIQQFMYKTIAYGLKVQADNTVRFSFWQTTEETLDTDTALVANTWYYIAATYDGSDTNIYINGVLDKTTNVSSGNIDTNANDLLIGAANTSNTSALDGDITNCRVYTTALTALELARNYRAQRKMFTY